MPASTHTSASRSTIACPTPRVRAHAAAARRDRLDRRRARCQAAAVRQRPATRNVSRRQRASPRVNEPLDVNRTAHFRVDPFTLYLDPAAYPADDGTPVSTEYEFEQLASCRLVCWGLHRHGADRLPDRPRRRSAEWRRGVRRDRLPRHRRTGARGRTPHLGRRRRRPFDIGWLRGRQRLGDDDPGHGLHRSRRCRCRHRLDQCQRRR